MPNNTPKVLSTDPTPVHVTVLLIVFPINIVKKSKNKYRNTQSYIINKF